MTSSGNIGNPPNSGNPSATTVVTQADANKDGIPEVIVATDLDGDNTFDQTGIYNVKTAEGRRALVQALVDSGLAVPDFLNHNYEFVDTLSPEALAGLESLSQEVSNLIAGETGGTIPATAPATGAQTAAPTTRSSSSGLSSTSAAGGSTSGLSDLQGRWAGYISQFPSGMDINALIQWVLRDAYMENTKDLHFYAQKVQFYNELKKKVREEVMQARELMAAQAGNDPEAGVVYPDDWDGPQPYVKQKFETAPNMVDGELVPHNATGDGEVGTKEDLETYIRNLEETLNGVGDDAQLANVDLQNMLQKQQQTLQMMSNISKMLHDTAMAIIRKIG